MAEPNVQEKPELEIRLDTFVRDFVHSYNPATSTLVFKDLSFLNRLRDPTIEYGRVYIEWSYVHMPEKLKDLILSCKTERLEFLLTANAFPLVTEILARRLANHQSSTPYISIRGNNTKHDGLSNNPNSAVRPTGTAPQPRERVVFLRQREGDDLPTMPFGNTILTVAEPLPGGVPAGIARTGIRMNPNVAPDPVYTQNPPEITPGLQAGDDDPRHNNAISQVDLTYFTEDDDRPTRSAIHPTLLLGIRHCRTLKGVEFSCCSLPAIRNILMEIGNNRSIVNVEFSYVDCRYLTDDTRVIASLLGKLCSKDSARQVRRFVLHRCALRRYVKVQILKFFLERFTKFLSKFAERNRVLEIVSIYLEENMVVEHEEDERLQPDIDMEQAIRVHIAQTQRELRNVQSVAVASIASENRGGPRIVPRDLWKHVRNTLV